MKILIIGNGFDLAHGLPTTYKNFLDFCERAKRIYTYGERVTLKEYEERSITDWNVCESVKKKLLQIYETRTCEYITMEDGKSSVKITTKNIALEEMKETLFKNTWINYFKECPSYVGDNWIDFESEIARVVQVLEEARDLVLKGDTVQSIQENHGRILMAILKANKGSLKDSFSTVTNIEKLGNVLAMELSGLIRSLEIYITEFINDIDITIKKSEIVKISPDCVLSFNYSNSFERVYGTSKTEYDYIHGKSDINNTIYTNNMVLGIDEYLPEERRNKDVSFIAFKKFYQRIHKGTGNMYKKWIDIIVKDSKKKNKVIYDNKDHSKDNVHCLYIYGHSLDIKDGDILREFILNDNVITKIYYYRTYNLDGTNDNGRKSLGEKIANLVKVIGQDELIRRTSSTNKTIEFILQEE